MRWMEEAWRHVGVHGCPCQPRGKAHQAENRQPALNEILHAGDGDDACLGLPFRHRC